MKRLNGWNPGWRMSVFVAVMLPTVIALGFWQLDRAAEKRGYQARYFDNVGMLAVVPGDPVPEPAFQRVRLTGTYVPSQSFLVDNRVHEGVPGYWVVSRFDAEDGRTWLVNRGWVAAPATRESLPAVSAPPGKVRIEGLLWPDMGLPPLLAQDPWADGWPKRVQRLNVARMAAYFDAAQAVEVRLESGQPGALVAAGLGVEFTPERHVGYAVQWFALSVVLAIAFVVFGYRKRSRDD
ncbi:MAG: SURF1 family protein [Pseudomonadales bacterium]